MIDESLTIRSLRKRLTETLKLKAELYAWENRSFIRPDPPTQWIRESVVPVEESLAAYGRLVGITIVRYEVVYPRNQGTEEPLAIVAKIKEAFKVGTAFTSGPDNEPVEVRVERCVPGTGFNDENWYYKPVSITVRAYGAH